MTFISPAKKETRVELNTVGVMSLIIYRPYKNVDIFPDIFIYIYSIYRLMNSYLSSKTPQTVTLRHVYKFSFTVSWSIKQYNTRV